MNLENNFPTELDIIEVGDYINKHRRTLRLSESAELIRQSQPEPMINYDK